MLDIEEQKMFYPTTRDLTITGDLKLTQVYELEELNEASKKEPRRYIRGQVVSYRGDELVSKGAAIKLFQGTLKQFTHRNLSVGEENVLFRVVERTVKNKKHISLQCVFDETRYIQLSEAQGILDDLYEASQFFSTRYLSNSADWTDDINISREIRLMEQIDFQISMKEEEPFLKRFLTHIPKIVLWQK